MNQARRRFLEGLQKTIINIKYKDLRDITRIDNLEWFIGEGGGAARITPPDETLQSVGGMMCIPKKIILSAIVVAFFLGVSPAFAELDGHWAGGGAGSCYTPAGNIIHPWMSWNGYVEEGVFEGTWVDDDANQGTFEGSILYFYSQATPPYYTFAHCEGTWTWISPNGTQPVVMGSFEMEFNVSLETCEGYWTTPDAASINGIWGERIEE